ncbi:hypothetical protein [Chryseobacterium sp. KCF3-3]|uniref:hypothetical protein n=1 Tax=Chryseobacterium sp. KCF3-3 TaxID=3231511 RepID=UPI0038B28AE6
MKKIIITFSLFIASFTFAQETAPPPPSMPTVENKIVIDNLIKTAGFEKYIYSYCLEKIEQAAKENNWNEKKTQEIIKSIHFNQFKDTIYNTFSLYSKEDLISLVKLFEKLNHNKKNINLIPISDTIQHNLEGFATDLIKGDYLFLNK